MKKIISKTMLTLICISLVATFSIIGCKEEVGKTTEEGGTEEATIIETTEEEVISEPIKLISWGNPNMPDAFKAFVDGFNSAQDKYIVDHIVFPDPYDQNLLSKWGAGERPDILNYPGAGLASLNAEENLLDLSDMDFVDRIVIPNLLELAKTKQGDTIYGPCIFYPQTIAYMYNKEIFNELGLKVPVNYEELKAVCKSIKNGGYIPLFDCAGDKWTTYFQAEQMQLDLIYNDNFQWINKLNSNEDDFTNPLYLNGLKKIKELLDLGYYNENVASATWADGKAALMNNEAAIASGWGGDWIYPIMVEEFGKEAVDSKIGFFPIGDQSPVVMTVVGNAWACWYAVKSGDAAKEEGAKEFIKFLTGAEPYQEYYQKFITDYGILSAFEGFENPELALPVQDMLAYLDIYPSMLELSAYYVPGATANHYIHISEMLAGELNPEGVAEAMSADYRSTARDAGVEAFQD